MIGQDAPKQQIIEFTNNITVEGICTLKSIYKLIKSKKINIPIIDIMYNILFNNTKKDTLIGYLVI